MTPAVPTHLLFGRRAHADPLALVGEVTSASLPTLAELGPDGEGWLELVAVPADEVRWILRAGQLVAGAPA